MHKIALILATAVSGSGAPLCTSGATLADYIAAGPCSFGDDFQVLFGAYRPPIGGPSASEISVTPLVSSRAVTLVLSAIDSPFSAFRPAFFEGTTARDYEIRYILTGPYEFDRQLGLVCPDLHFGDSTYGLALTANGVTTIVPEPWMIGGPGVYPNSSHILFVSNHLYLSATATGERGALVRVNAFADVFGYQVPEPGTTALLVSGLLGIGFLRARRA